MIRSKPKKLKTKTLNFVIFQRRLSAEIRNYWYCRTSFEYSVRWWKEGNKANQFSHITDYPGDRTKLFSSIDISPSEYISAKDDILWYVRGNAITNIVTAFETYLYTKQNVQYIFNLILLEILV